MPSPRLSRAKSVDVLFPGRASKKEYRKKAAPPRIFQVPERFYWKNGRISKALPTLATSIPVKARMALEDDMQRKALARRLTRRGLPERKALAAIMGFLV